MPPGAALLELWPQPGMWRLYEHTAEWAGLLYRCVHTTMCIWPLSGQKLSLKQALGIVFQLGLRDSL